MAREREVKLRILDAAGFRRLADELGPVGERLQRNTYYDTEDGSLWGEGILVRVREEEGRVLLTIKRGAIIGPGRIESEEWETDLAPDLWAALREREQPLATITFHPLLDAARGRPLHPVGRLENRRLLRRGPGGALYELDETRFPWGETHFELEIETDDPDGELERAKDLLRSSGVAFRDSVETKHERLLRGLDRKE